MADIFISYSKSDHALALKLSAFLESEGWTVWWDKSLGAADLYRDEIMKQLAAARAVITIWTPNSIKSDWVRAEAGRAKADGKLIPVKTDGLSYPDIPLPFGEMHTENVGSTELIRAAIVAQIAKPSVSQSPFWQITGLFKYQVLTWIGIVGSAITLFANLKGVIELAGWARDFVAQWHEWNQMIWGSVFGWIGVKLIRELAPVISFCVFSAMLIVGVNLSVRREKKLVTSQTERATKTFFVGVLLFVATMTVGLATAIAYVTLKPFDQTSVTYYTVVGVIPFVVLPFVFPMGYLHYVGKDRVWILIASLLFLCMGGCLLFAPMNEFVYSKTVSSNTELSVIFLSLSVLFPILWMAVILFSPVQQLTRRLAFVVLGVLMLVVLSEISKLNLHQYI
ncbi:MAG: toll/interleukin-1 receptor domain-containing protein [Xanthobacteraceae bacterium]